MIINLIFCFCFELFESSYKCGANDLSMFSSTYRANASVLRLNHDNVT